jgi:hypothetical protein
MSKLLIIGTFDTAGNRDNLLALSMTHRGRCLRGKPDTFAV